ncbi:MAG: 3-hydroxyacyl-CoA dehydrogenase family protein [Bacteroidota bacterium]
MAVKNKSIVLIGSTSETAEFNNYLLAAGFKASLAASTRNSPDAHIVFDFRSDASAETFDFYKSLNADLLFINAAFTCVWQLKATCPKIKFPVIGFNGLPTLFKPAAPELSAANDEDYAAAETMLQTIGAKPLRVADRTGLAMPRLVSMIINEAYYTLQEGTATAEDIDLSMKLGTNYPYGPFDWGQKIGLSNVVRVLDSVYTDTHDERYRICPLLKKEAALISRNLLRLA